MEKEARMSIKIDPEIYQQFRAWCKENQTNVSNEVRRYIKKVLDEDRERKLYLVKLEQDLEKRVKK